MEVIQALTDVESLELLYDWKFWARPQQVPPDTDWSICFSCKGRGCGKTREGAEWIRTRVEDPNPEIGRRVALVAETPADARDTMIEGVSGLLNICPPWNRPTYEPSKRQLEWKNPNFPSFGAIAKVFTSAQPDWLRGPEHDTAWADEIAAWRYPDLTWTNLLLGLRMGPDPRVFATSTPKPIALIKKLINDPRVVKLRGTTYDNKANLSPKFFEQLITEYEGTRTGRQELLAQLLEESEGALWKREWLERNRGMIQLDELVNVVIAVDPAVTKTKTSNETGIVACGLDRVGNGWLLEDGSGWYSSKEWGDKAIDLFLRWDADEIVAETNNGGDLVVDNIKAAAEERDLTIKVEKVTASRGKRTRAEPVATKGEANRIKHLQETPDGDVCNFEQLEDQLCNWAPDTGQDSPDRLDAYVWGFSRLMIRQAPKRSPMTAPRARSGKSHFRNL